MGNGNKCNKNKNRKFFVSIAQPKNTSLIAKFYKIIFDTLEAYELLMIGLDKNNNQKYINKNGKIYKNLYELENSNLQEEIKNRLYIEEETQNLEDIRIVCLKENSSISREIAQSKSVRRFYNENLGNIMSNNMPKSSELVFDSSDGDLYGAMHSVAIKNIMLDKNNNLHFEIHDFYNFNPNRTSVKGRVGYKLQKQGDLKPYYIIIKVVVPNNIIDFYFRDYYKYTI